MSSFLLIFTVRIATGKYQVVGRGVNFRVPGEQVEGFFDYKNRSELE